ncbi:MAG: DUF493 domain-containing protein [Myxococcales bacterium]|nr:DUF493 domain-containing protein [Myxococcales bacterium]
MQGRRSPSRAALEGAHSFPGEYVIKAFGPGRGDFARRAQACAHAELHEARVVVHERASRTGKQTCVTLTLQVTRVEEVERIYERLHDLHDLLLIL